MYVEIKINFSEYAIYRGKSNFKKIKLFVVLLFNYRERKFIFTGVTRVCDTSYCHGMLITFEFYEPFYGRISAKDPDGLTRCSIQGHGKRRQNFFVGYSTCGSKLVTRITTLFDIHNSLYRGKVSRKTKVSSFKGDYEEQ